jgi:hypothetical protein
MISTTTSMIPLWDDEYNAEFRERIVRMRNEAKYLSRNSLH